MERVDGKAFPFSTSCPLLHAAPRTGRPVKMATHLRLPPGPRGAAPSTPGERAGRLGRGLQGPGRAAGLAAPRVLYKSRAAGGGGFPSAEHPPPGPAAGGRADPESPRHGCARRPPSLPANTARRDAPSPGSVLALHSRCRACSPLRLPGQGRSRRRALPRGPQPRSPPREEDGGCRGPSSTTAPPAPPR